MNRRLHPDLFESTPTQADESAHLSTSMVATRKLESELKETRKRVSHLESLVEVLETQMKHLGQNQDKRTDLLSQAISTLEKDLRTTQLQQSRGQQIIEEKMRQQRLTEGHIESLVDRFNGNLAQFENKLNTLQKVISEKQMTLMSYRSIIEQIVDEVEKLKARRPSL